MLHPSAKALSLFILISSVSGFSAPIFQEMISKQHTAPSKMAGVDIELPNFDELFSRIKSVSPLARIVMENDGGINGKRGFAAAVPAFPDEFHWKITESNSRRIVHHIDKIDNFNGIPGAPITRFRSSLKGPCLGSNFATFIMDMKERRQWDLQIQEVYEAYPVNDLDVVNILMGCGVYGDCARLGIGYCRTKSNLGIGAREQLTLCGVQEFPDGSCVIWGTEMTDRHNHLLPKGGRVGRARTHLFSTTLVPTSENTFDVEYVLHLEIGMPTWLTTPVLGETVKSLFKHAQKFYSDENGELGRFLKARPEPEEALVGRSGILMTP